MAVTRSRTAVANSVAAAKVVRRTIEHRTAITNLPPSLSCTGDGRPISADRPQTRADIPEQGLCVRRERRHTPEGGVMAKEELIQFEGLVTEILPDARFRVQLDAGHEIIAYTAGKMRKNRIKTLAGDRVTVEMSPYDLEKGRLVFRHKEERGGSA